MDPSTLKAIRERNEADSIGLHVIRDFGLWAMQADDDRRRLLEYIDELEDELTEHRAEQRERQSRLEDIPW